MALQATDLSFAYQAERQVLEGVTFGPRPGALTGVIGPNGSGKSTMLRLLLGILRPCRGSVTLDGTDMTSMSARERARRVAYIPQRTSPAFGFSVRECVRMGRLSSPRGASEATERALARVGLTARASEPFDTLSAGQQQRAILARALAQLDGVNSPVLLADEPASALDPAHTLEAMGILREATAAGATVVAVLHDLAIAERFCDDVLVLGGRGRVIAVGTAAKVLTPAVLDEAFGVRFTRGGSALIASLP